MTDTPDHQAKYQKLAAEYSKVRAQNQVLKRAVLEEQEKSSKHAELLQSLRRAEQENDSLNFRNQQLTCRLSLLQHDLQQLQTKGHRRQTHQRSSSSGGAGGDHVDVTVLMQELQAKISENASLHARVEELERAPPQQEGAAPQQERDLQERNADLTARLQQCTEALAMHQRSAQLQLEAQSSAAAATIAQLNRHIQALKLQVVRGAADAADDSPSSSSSSSYLSLAPLQQLEAAHKGALSPLSPLDDTRDSTGACALESKGPLSPLESSKDLTGPDALGSKGASKDSVLPLADLSKDICDKFGTFIKALCEVQLTHIAEGDLKAKDAIVKAQQGTQYWERLGPLLEEVFRRLDCPSEGVVPLAGSMSATTASTVAQLRIVSTLPPPGAAQAALRAVQSCWSAALPYLSALSANSSRSHSHSTLHRLLGLLADRCSALHAALSAAHTQWAAIERDEQDDIVTLALLDLVRAVENFVSAVRRRLEAGVERQSDVRPNLINVHNSSLPQSPNVYSNLPQNQVNHGLQMGSNLPQTPNGSSNLPQNPCLPIGQKPSSGVEMQPSQQSMANLSLNCLSGIGQATNGLSFPIGQETGLGRDSLPTPSSPTSLSSQEDSSISVNVSTNDGNSSGSGHPSDSGPHSGIVVKSRGNGKDNGNFIGTNGKETISGGPSGNAADSRGDSGNASELTSARLAQLHRQREHWRLEYHLLSHKHAKLTKILKDTDALKALGSGAAKLHPTSIVGEVTVPPGGGDAGRVQDLKGRPVSLEDSNGRKGRDDPMEEPKGLKDSSKEHEDPKNLENPKGRGAPDGGADEDTWRESMVRQHLTARCTKLFLELTKTCSKATLLQGEAEAAVSRALEAEAVAGALENELDQVRGERAKLSEELKTTCLNYEQQMAAMADHLAGLSERIAEQEDLKAFPRPRKK